jgi:hypothetical protein
MTSIGDSALFIPLDGAYLQLCLGCFPLVFLIFGRYIVIELYHKGHINRKRIEHIIKDTIVKDILVEEETLR